MSHQSIRYASTLVLVTLGLVGCDRTAKMSVKTDAAPAQGGANAVVAPPAPTPASDLPVDPRDLPATFKELGLFSEGAVEKSLPGVLTYDVKVHLWSDNVTKKRFVYVPPGAMIKQDKATGKLVVPPGTVLVKHFSRGPNGEKPLETRVIALRDDGTWRFAAYQWTDAATTQRTTKVTRIKGADASEPEYRIPSQEECTLCHNDATGMVLGFQPDQLAVTQADGSSQAALLAKLGIFDSAAAEAVSTTKPMVDPADESLPLDDRARSYMDLNCGVCHKPGSGGDIIDLRGTVDAAQLVKTGLVVPKDPESSKIYKKFMAVKYRMPPQSTLVDPLGAKLFKAWIEQWPVAGEATAGTTTGATTGTTTDGGTGTTTGTTTGSTTSGGTTTDGGTGTTTGTTTGGGTTTDGGTGTTTGTTTSGGTTTDGGTGTTTGTTTSGGTGTTTGTTTSGGTTTDGGTTGSGT